MAQPEALKLLRELQSRPDNKMCVDCPSRNPQWASVSYGVFMCLECSGKHRGLGVHISFVRSVSMDAWKPDELKKMSLGGNDNLNAFLKQYGVDKSTEIKLKYNSKAAEYYRDKIRAGVEGRPYAAPPPDASNTGTQAPPVYGGMSRPHSEANMGGNRTSRGGAGGAADWEEWGDGGAAAQHRHAHHTSISGAAGGGGAGGIYTPESLAASAAGKDQFFARKMNENQTRPDNVHPSQGGKYVGFGSSPLPPKAPASSLPIPVDVDALAGLFTKGLSTLGTAVAKGAETVQAAARDPNVSYVAAQGRDLGNKGWAALSSLVSTVSSSDGFKNVSGTVTSQLNSFFGLPATTGGQGQGGNPQGEGQGGYSQGGYGGYSQPNEQAGGYGAPAEDGWAWGGEERPVVPAAAVSAAPAPQYSAAAPRGTVSAGGFSGFDVDPSEDVSAIEQQQRQMASAAKPRKGLGARPIVSSGGTAASPAPQGPPAEGGAGDEWGKW